jgi:hypothetical protein
LIWRWILKEESSKITLTIFNNIGQQVEILLNNVQSKGEHQVRWDATGQPPGLYFCRLTANGHTVTRKMIIAR